MQGERTRVEALLEAMLAMAVADRDARQGFREDRRSEIILAEAGLPLTDVARLTGKNYDAVAKAVQRQRAAGKNRGEGSQHPNASN